VSAPDFAAWFAAQRFRNFEAREFTGYFAAVRKGVRNHTPPRSLWPNIVPALRVADDLRDSFGEPCIILSSYRAPDYNRAVGGAPASLHMQFKALDLCLPLVGARQAYRRLVEWRRAGRFTGGLGLYPSSGFVHLDTRGTNATWSGR